MWGATVPPGAGSVGGPGTPEQRGPPAKLGCSPCSLIAVLLGHSPAGPRSHCPAAVVPSVADGPTVGRGWEIQAEARLCARASIFALLTFLWTNI